MAKAHSNPGLAAEATVPLAYAVSELCPPPMTKLSYLILKVYFKISHCFFEDSSPELNTCPYRMLSQRSAPSVQARAAGLTYVGSHVQVVDEVNQMTDVISNQNLLQFHPNPLS